MKSKKNVVPSNTKERLLDSALKVFSSKGYAASIREIAEASGTTLPSLYYYFGSKEGLFRELMNVHFEKFQSSMNADEETGSAREQLKKSIVTTYFNMVEDIQFVRLMRLISYGPPQSAPPFDFEPYHRHFHEFLVAMIKCGIKNGEFRANSPDDMAWIIRGAMQVAAEDLCFVSVRKIDKKKLERILDIILDGFSGGE